jgi:hypothetical protein
MYSKTFFVLLTLLFLSTTFHAQNKTPLISDMEIANMIQKELEAFGADVSTMDAWQMSRRMGITQRFAGEMTDRRQEEDLLWSVGQNELSKNAPPMGMGAVNQTVQHSFGFINKVNVLYDMPMGMMQKNTPLEVTKYLGPVGDKGAFVSTKIVDTYPPGLDKFFLTMNAASYYLNLANVLYEWHEKGAAKVSTVSKLKLATSGMGLYFAKFATGTAGPFAGVAIYMMDYFIDKWQEGKEFRNESMFFTDYRMYYDDVNWGQAFESGSWEAVMGPLGEYWEADLEDENLTEGAEDRREWIMDNIQNHRDYFAHKYLKEVVTPQLVDFFEREAEYAKEQAREALREYLNDLIDQETIIRMKLKYQNAYGRKIETYPKVELIIHQDGEEMDDLFYDVNINGEQVEIKINKLQYLAWMTRHGGVLHFKLKIVVDGKEQILETYPDFFHPLIGEDGAGGKIKVEGWDKQAFMALQRPIDVWVPTYLVKVKVVGSRGESLVGATVQGPDGKRAEIDDRGYAYMSVPTIGRSWIHLVDASGNLNGGKVELPDVAGPADQVKEVTLHGISPEAVPPMPVFPPLDISQLRLEGDRMLRQLSAGEIDIQTAQQLGYKINSSIQSIREATRQELENGVRLYRKRAAQLDIAPQEREAFIDKKRQAFDQQYKDTEAYAEEVQEKLGNEVIHWKNKLEEQLTTITTHQTRLGEISSALQKAARQQLVDASRANHYSQVRSFRSMTDVENEMSMMSDYKEQVERLLSEVKGHQTQLRQLLPLYQRQLADLAEIREVVNMKRTDYRFGKLINTLTNALHAVRIAEALVDQGDLEGLIKQYDRNYSILSWLQLRSLNQIEMMKQYDALLQNLPAEMKSDHPVYAQLDSVQKKLSDASSAAHWAAAEGVDYAGKPTHDGYGVEAWKYFREAEKAWPALQSGLEKTKIVVAKWSEEVKNLQESLKEQVEAMRKGGWIVEDVRQSMMDRLRQGVTDLNKSEKIAAQQVSIEEQMKKMEESFQRSPANWLASLDALSKDAGKYKAILKQAMQQANSRNRAGAEQTLQSAQDLLQYPPIADAKLGRGRYRELILDKEGYLLEKDLQFRIHRLKIEEEEAALAHVVLYVEGGNLADLMIKVTDPNDNEYYNLQENTLILPPGDYTIRFYAEGKKVEPAEQQLSLSKSATYALKVKISALADSKDLSFGVKTMPDFNFEQLQRRAIARNLRLVDDVRPAWCENSQVVVVQTSNLGLKGFDLKTGQHWELHQKEPVRPSNWNDVTVASTKPQIIGNTVFYLMNMTSYDLAESSNTQYWMTIPLKGGQAAPLFEEVTDKFKVLDIRMNKEIPEFLLLGTINGKSGFFLLKDATANYRTAELLHSLSKEETYLRIAVSPDWKRFAIGDYFKPVSVWALGGAKIATFEAGVFARWITFSPDGQWLAGDRVLKEDPQLQMVAAAIDAPGQVFVVEKTAIQYGVPGWSPDGRYLAFRAFRGGNKEDLMVVDLTGGSSSFAEGGFLLQQ